MDSFHSQPSKVCDIYPTKNFHTIPQPGTLTNILYLVTCMLSLNVLCLPLISIYQVVFTKCGNITILSLLNSTSPYFKCILTFNHS